MQTQKCWETSFKEGHVLGCNIPANCVVMPLKHRLERKLHHVALSVELDRSFSKDYRDFFLNHRMLQHEIATSLATSNGHIFPTF